MSASQLSRRDLFVGVLSTLAMVRTSNAAPGVTEEAVVTDISAQLGAELMAIGHQYLKEYHQTANVETLASNLARRLNGAADNLPMRLSMAVQEDFARGHVVRVGGWLLSLTEARMFALAYLARSAVRMPI